MPGLRVRQGTGSVVAGGHDILIVDTEDFEDLEDILGDLSNQGHLNEGTVLLQVRVSCSHKVREGLNCLWCVKVIC